jgi:hypothetical protein
MEEKAQKKPPSKARPEKGKPSKKTAQRLRKGIFRLDFKKGSEPLPAEITGPIVGVIPRTQYSYEIIWLEEDQPTEA